MAKTTREMDYLARAVESTIVIYEPNPLPGQLEKMATEVGFGYLADGAVAERMTHAKYTPIMKFDCTWLFA